MLSMALIVWDAGMLDGAEHKKLLEQRAEGEVGDS